MKFARDHRGERLQSLDITAMIDVVFLLIIFFMTTAQFARLTRTQVDLPDEQGEEEAASRAPAIVINVSSAGEIIVGGASVSPVALGAMLAAEIAEAGGDADDLRVLIRADQAAAAAHINAIAEDLATLGVRSWRLATSPTAARGGAS